MARTNASVTPAGAIWSATLSSRVGGGDASLRGGLTCSSIFTLVDGWCFCAVGNSEIPRPSRLEFENAIYNVVARGDGQRKLLQMLVITFDSLNVLLISSWSENAYCWMLNHIDNKQTTATKNRYVWAALFGPGISFGKPSISYIWPAPSRRPNLAD